MEVLQRATVDRFENPNTHTDGTRNIRLKQHSDALEEFSLGNNANDVTAPAEIEMKQLMCQFG